MKSPRNGFGGGFNRDPLEGIFSIKTTFTEKTRVSDNFSTKNIKLPITNIITLYNTVNQKKSGRVSTMVGYQTERAHILGSRGSNAVRSKFYFLFFYYTPIEDILSPRPSPCRALALTRALAWALARALAQRVLGTCTPPTTEEIDF